MLKTILTKNLTHLSGVYALLIIEYALISIMPTITGKIVDALLTGAFFWPIVAELGSHWILVGIICLRRVLDTRIFSRIWVKTAVDIVVSLLERGMERSAIVTRSLLSERLVDVFENTIPLLVQTIFMIVGAIVALSVVLRWWSLLVVIVGVGISLYIEVTTTRINGALDQSTQDCRERINKHILSGSTRVVQEAYEAMGRTYVQISDLDAARIGGVEFLHSIAYCLVMVDLVGQGSTAGGILAMLMYCERAFNYCHVSGTCFIQVQHAIVAEKRLK